MNKISKFHFTTLAENPQFFDDVIKLVEKEFHYSSEFSYLDDFYFLMNPMNFNNCLIAIDTDSNTLAAHLAFCKRDLVKNNTFLPIVMIGGIATSSQYKKLGLFRELMNLVIKKNETSCALYVLWSEITGLYEKFDFYLAGGLIQSGNSFFDDLKKPAGFSKFKFKDISNKEFDQIISIYQNSVEQKLFAPKRSRSDWANIKNINSVDLYIKRDEEGNVVQYFIINKGRDLNNIVHEFGSLPNFEKDLIKILKPYKTWMCESHKHLISEYQVFFNAYIRLGNLKLINDFLSTISGGKLIISDIDNAMVKFTFDENHHTLSHSEFMTALFGPNIINEFKNYDLSLYIPGIDSV